MTDDGRLVMEEDSAVAGRDRAVGGAKEEGE